MSSPIHVRSPIFSTRVMVLHDVNMQEHIYIPKYIEQQHRYVARNTCVHFFHMYIFTTYLPAASLSYLSDKDGWCGNKYVLALVIKQVSKCTKITGCIYRYFFASAEFYINRKPRQTWQTDERKVRNSFVFPLLKDTVSYPVLWLSGIQNGWCAPLHPPPPASICEPVK